MMIRDPEERVLLCQLTYKQDWDLPGGVVEVGESPRIAVGGRSTEELGLAIEPGGLLLTDWLPPWGGWDDAVCLVFDGGVHPRRSWTSWSARSARSDLRSSLPSTRSANERPTSPPVVSRPRCAMPEGKSTRRPTPSQVVRRRGPLREPWRGIPKVNSGKIGHVTTYVFDFAEGNKDHKGPSRR